MKLLALMLMVMAMAFAGCSSSMQWWRVGNCLVIYDTRGENHQIVVAGQQCDIKREELAAVSGNIR